MPELGLRGGRSNLIKSQNNSHRVVAHDARTLWSRVEELADATPINDTSRGRLAMAEDRPSGFWSTLPGVITAITGLITAVAGLVAALYAANIIGGTSTPPDRRVVEATRDGPPPPAVPYGIEVIAVTDPLNAVRIADKAKSIAPPGAEIRLYKRITNRGTVAWAPVVLYTDSSIASNEIAKYKLDGWDPEVVTLVTWCPNPRSIPSPTGTPLTIPVFDCARS
jgi:hypothetical protein